MGKGENAGNQHFLLFPLFQKAFFLRGVKSCGCEVKRYYTFIMIKKIKISNIESILRFIK